MFTVNTSGGSQEFTSFRDAFQLFRQIRSEVILTRSKNFVELYYNDQEGSIDLFSYEPYGKVTSLNNMW